MKDDSDWLVLERLVYDCNGRCMNLPVPAVQALHPAERLQLLFPTFTVRALQPSFALLCSKWMCKTNNDCEYDCREIRCDLSTQ